MTVAYLPSIRPTKPYHRNLAKPPGIGLNDCIDKMRGSNRDAPDVLGFNGRRSDDIFHDRPDPTSDIWRCWSFARGKHTSRRRINCSNVKNGSIGVSSADVNPDAVHGRSPFRM